MLSSHINVVSASIPPALEYLEATVGQLFVHYLSYLDRLPGGLIILRYIKSSYKDDPIRSLFELALFLFAVNYFLSSKKKSNKNELVRFTKQEIDDLVEDWEPLPLVEKVGSLENWQLREHHVKGHNGAHVEIIDRPELGKVANMSSLDFLNLNESPITRKAAEETIRASGVGACGPPNFYGTQDVHVRLEEDLSRFLQTENAILYGQDFVTPGSVLNAFLKRGDLAVVDLGVNVALQKALIVSRCDIEWYDHNDMEHLEQILKELDPVLAKQKPLRRRFIVTEGLFNYTGDLVKLPEIVRLKNKYKYRLFLDEQLSIGCIGKAGRGVCEHFGVSRNEIAITVGSLANAFSSSGGFCVGVKPMVHHQRINSTAYVFSAALPPYSAKTASLVIHILESSEGRKDSNIVANFQDKSRAIHQAFRRTLAKSPLFEVVSDDESPIVHLALTNKFREEAGFPSFYGTNTFLLTGKPSPKINKFSHEYNAECFILQQIIEKMLNQHLALINRTRIVLSLENLPVEKPHLTVHINEGVSTAKYQQVVRALPEIAKSVCTGVTVELLEKEMIN